MSSLMWLNRKTNSFSKRNNKTCWHMLKNISRLTFWHISQRIISKEWTIIKYLETIRSRKAMASKPRRPNFTSTGWGKKNHFQHCEILFLSFKFSYLDRVSCNTTTCTTTDSTTTTMSLTIWTRKIAGSSPIFQSHKHGPKEF